MKISIPIIFKDIFKPYRYKVFFGGRGSGKSWAVAGALIVLAMKGKVRILCTREIQNSIRDSVHKLLRDTINRYDVVDHFKVTDKSIICLTTGSEFIFEGLHRNINKIKSMEGIDYCWIEEGHSVTSASLDILIPTIRQEGSEVWVTFNREKDDDPVYERLVVQQRNNALIRRANYTENPFFPNVLREEMEYDKRTNYDKYLHVWEGEPLMHSEAQVFKDKFSVESFDTPDDVSLYYGADWGFSVDPTTLVRCFIEDKTLYIDYEAYGVGVEIDKLPEMFDTVPESRKWKIYGDSARPETISYIRNRGFNIWSCKKWSGCVEDRIEFLKSFEKIVIHDRCIHTKDEFKLYSYKIDKLTGEILTKLEDKHNHIIDALGYALQDLMRGQRLRPTIFTADSLGL